MLGFVSRLLRLRRDGLDHYIVEVEYPARDGCPTAQEARQDHQDIVKARNPFVSHLPLK